MTERQTAPKPTFEGDLYEGEYTESLKAKGRAIGYAGNYAENFAEGYVEGYAEGYVEVVLYDLSAPIETGMPVYPGDPEVTAGPALTVARDGVNVLSLHLGSHSGTHVDAPSHIDDALPTLDELPLERFCGPAVVVDVRGLPPGTAIGAEPFHEVEGGTIVLIATGWRWGSPGHPYLSEEAAALLVERGVRTVGIDALSVDPTPGDAFPAHETLLRAHAVIVENLVGLDRLPGDRPIEVSMFPLRIAGGDGSPVRAIARVG